MYYYGPQTRNPKKRVSTRKRKLSESESVPIRQQHKCVDAKSVFATDNLAISSRSESGSGSGSVPTRQQPQRNVNVKPASFPDVTADLAFSFRYELRHIPSSASSFTDEDIEGLRAVFEPASDKNEIIPNVEITAFPDSFILPEIDRSIIEKKDFNINNLEIYDGYAKAFVNYLHEVVTNAGLDIGAQESKTDSLVTHLLARVCEWPFGIRIKERYKLKVSEKDVNADPGVVVDMREIAIMVTDNKHLKNCDPPDFWEAKILAEILPVDI